ncbi:hypothetical protein [Lonepinella sp. BR2474]|uniref:hypothetical protein n=1 Tax=Lonepinella sp. BR2474 TaxID=3434548 RepID=UPI003F6E2B74
MKKFLLLIATIFFMTACANDWSASGVPDVYEGQSQESVLSTLQKNNWVILKQTQDEQGNLFFIAQGKTTKQFQNLFGSDCREGSFGVYKKEGLQILETRACENTKK